MAGKREGIKIGIICDVIAYRIRRKISRKKWEIKNPEKVKAIRTRWRKKYEQKHPERIKLYKLRNARKARKELHEWAIRKHLRDLGIEQTAENIDRARRRISAKRSRSALQTQAFATALGS